jgi:hypothetical protein
LRLVSFFALPGPFQTLRHKGPAPPQALQHPSRNDVSWSITFDCVPGEWMGVAAICELVPPRYFSDHEFPCMSPTVVSKT